MTQLPIQKFHNENTDNLHLQFSKIELKNDYCKKWNITSNDFICLTKNGELINNSLYRIGGLNYPDLKKDNYFQLIKHIEAFYDDGITKDKTRKRHLESRWCILDKNGVEKVEFKAFQSPYLSGGVIYSVDGKYYNIETGELYGSSYSSISSKNYIFLNNEYDDDKSKRGVMKINKKDGSIELFS